MDIDDFEDCLDWSDTKARKRIATASREYRTGMSVPAGDLLADLPLPASRARKRTITKR